MNERAHTDPAVASSDSRVRVLLSRLEAFVGTRWAAVTCFSAALAVYGVESLAWPLFHGRDDGQYIRYYLDFFHARPVYPEYMLYRTPVAPFFLGPLLQLGGATLAEIALGVLFAASVTAIAAAGKTFGTWAAVGSALAFLAYPGYGILFHQVSSDPIFAALYALWLWAIARTALRPTTWKFALHGVIVVMLILARPAGQVFVVFVLFPLLVSSGWRRRLAGAGAFAFVVAALLAGWSLHNYLRFGDFTVSRTGAAQVPMYRVFIVDRLAGPNDGPASRELARAVRDHLLTTEPYKAYGITLAEFYSSGSSRMWEDLIGLSDEVWGWNSDYSHIRAAAVEAIEAHPRRYVADVVESIRGVMRASYVEPAAERAPPATTPQPVGAILVHGRRLPRPTEGQPIPHAHLYWAYSTPDRRIWLDWSSLAQPMVRFRHAVDARNARKLESGVTRLTSLYPNRDGSSAVARVFDDVDTHYPPMWLWLLVGAAGTALRRPRRWVVPAFAAGMSLLLVAATALSVPPVVQYRLPLDPGFVLLGVVGLVGIRRSRQRAGDSNQKQPHP